MKGYFIMKEKIYTIPVTDAFSVDCECPLCVLEKKLEDENLEYILGPSLMEPDGRIETNEKGFCQRHFEKLYKRQENRLGLGLIIDTHMQEQNKNIKNAYINAKASLDKDANLSSFQNFTQHFLLNKEAKNGIDILINELQKLESKCAICDKLEKTMDRYIDVILYLYFEEQDFTRVFHSKKGFCIKHFKDLLTGSKKYLSPKQAAIFTDNLVKIQLENLNRLQEEVNWFTKKFDYRNVDAPWGNSQDSLPRSIQKLVGYCEFK
jgi:hypothetical protein